MNYCFDRKEEKDHGEGGGFVGAALKDGDNVVVVDDVVTSGKAFGEVLPKLRGAADVKINGFVVTVDRMEKTLGGEKSATAQIAEDFGIPVFSIVNIHDIIAALENGVIPGAEFVPAMKKYLEDYGV
ncbi:hypothetical protein FACS189499_07310 [Clostridia bacterium]|nr:hypothetical protein FACS189499_07310 [Clostridia bacterium]